MKIVTVIPIGKGIRKENLTYFTSLPVETGSLVSVPVRKKLVDALVIKVTDASHLKTGLRKADFTLKKIEKINQPVFFTPAFIEACVQTAEHFLVSPGEVINEFTPQAALSGKLKLNDGKKIAIEISKKNILPEEYAIQDSLEERILYYRRAVREAFAKNESVFLCVPNADDINVLLPELERGINNYTVVLSSALGAKKLKESWLKAVTEKKPILIIGTSLFLSIPRLDLKTFILENERNNFYKSRQRPFIDTRTFIRKLVKATSGRLIVGDSVLRTETIHGLNEGYILPASPINYRLKYQAGAVLATPVQTEKRKAGDAPVLSEEFESMIKYALEKGDKIAIITHRRGLHPITKCSDCGKIVSCEKCGSPLVLHQVSGSRIFMCHKCGVHEKAGDHCEICGGWRLSLYGTGIEGILETIKRTFPKAQVFKITSDETTPKTAREIARKFSEEKSCILLGTEMALRYIEKPVAYTALVSIDSLFNVPDFSISEKILGLITKTHSLATKHFLLQTHNPEEPLFEQALTGNLLDFFRAELAERKILKYPPFAKLIKVKLKGPKEDIRASLEDFIEMVKEYKPQALPSLKDDPDEITVVFKIEEEWPDKNLADILKALPPAWEVNVDPESIF